MITSALQTNKIIQPQSNPNISPSERTLVKKFSGYLNGIENTRIIAVSNYDYYNMPYTTRWSPEYKKKMIAKMYAIEDYYKRSGKSIVTLLTLTGYQNGKTSIDAKGKITTREELFNHLTHGWRLLSNLIAKICPSLEYIWVMEPHKSGYPHMHVAVFGYIPKDMQERLTRLWSEKYHVGSAEHGIDFSVKPIKESIQSIRNYLMKYISKGIGAEGKKSWTPEEWIYHAIARKHRHRYIGMSHAISLYCTAHKLRYKFRKYIHELSGTDIGLPTIPLDKQGIINTIKSFKWRAPHDSSPPPDERWHCIVFANKGTITLSRKSSTFNTIVSTETATWINHMISITAGYNDNFIRFTQPQWKIGRELSEQTRITEITERTTKTNNKWG